MEFTITNDRTTIKDTSALWKDTGTKEIYAGEEKHSHRHHNSGKYGRGKGIYSQGNAGGTLLQEKR